MTFALHSPVFQNGGAIPDRYARDGENLSPPLRWSDAPDEAKSFMLIVEDPDAPSGVFRHWAIHGINAHQTELHEGVGAEDPGRRQAINDPPAFVAAHELTPTAHLDMQAALQPFVDNAISKTVNVPADIGFEAFQAIYDEAYDRGLKGCTVFRAGAPSPLVAAQAAYPPC